jgi:aminomethyltransferase
MRVIAPSEARRIEAGIFNYGSDLRVDDTPLHVTGLERLVEFDQDADFLGREALRRLGATGVDRKLVGIDIDGPPMSDEGALNDFWPVEDADGARVGRVTAGAWSPRLERNVGYAWVPIGLSSVGTPLRVASPAEPRTATVASLPFVDERKQTPKA